MMAWTRCVKPGRNWAWTGVVNGKACEALMENCVRFGRVLRMMGRVHIEWMSKTRELCGLQ